MSIAHSPAGVARPVATPVPARPTSTADPHRSRDHLHSVDRDAGPGLPLPVVGSDLRVRTVGGAVVEYANLDHAASTPALAVVKQAVDAALGSYASVHRGTGYASQVSTQWYERARDEVRRFVGARPGDHVVFTRNTTDSLNLLARALPRDTTVFVFESEHHAALLPWSARRTVRLPVPGSVRDAELLLRAALGQSQAAHRLVVLTGASNVTGEVWPVAELAGVARSLGARVVLDAAQLAPHRRVDLASLDVDYVALSGHKLYAPFGTGALVGRADWLDAAPPYLSGGGATRSVTERSTAWHQGASRHEAGSPNVIGAIALAAACAALSRHRDAVERHERRLGQLLVAGLEAVPGVQTYSIFGRGHDRVPVVAFTVAGLDSSVVSAALSAEYGIGVRDGKFCAHLLVDALLEDPRGATPATAVRASAGLANTAEHVQRLVAAVAGLAEHGPAREYQQGTTGLEPVGDERDLSAPGLW